MSVVNTNQVSTSSLDTKIEDQQITVQQTMNQAMYDQYVYQNYLMQKHFLYMDQLYKANMENQMMDGYKIKSTDSSRTLQITQQQPILVKEEYSQSTILNQLDPRKSSVQLTTIQREKVEFKSEVEELLVSFVENLGTNNNLLQKYREQINGRNELIQIYDLISLKYTSQKKSREEIIKFIMRKALKYLFGCVQENQDGILSLKNATKICLDHYFQDMDAEVQVLTLPFRKDCKIKTMNSSFLKKLFQCPKFANDYQIFLNNFDEIIMKDNEKKTINASINIQFFFEKDTLHKIRTMRRMPWTIHNLKLGKQIAESLLTKYVNLTKKVKKVKSQSL